MHCLEDVTFEQNLWFHPDGKWSCLLSCKPDCCGRGLFFSRLVLQLWHIQCRAASKIDLETEISEECYKYYKKQVLDRAHNTQNQLLTCSWNGGLLAVNCCSDASLP